MQKKNTSFPITSAELIACFFFLEQGESGNEDVARSLWSSHLISFG